MAHIVIMNAEIGGKPAIYETREKTRSGNEATVISTME